ncbi:MAG: phosphoribosylformylglycinamidine synthase subunit PurS [Nitrospinota bacterium]|nr:phosphoribosylformylglycinamidine synthase subunit PurS [Nitrospinota bacterium]MDP7554628.1 phosphoribosylformylglycinamidine synthase subunit PurS [Nitrospinota bacterium]MDP7580325.1 phosphoribosylformylglycinamidine synthase subunit PurS [Nitrospinota bacterium]HJN03250.1 phosphoribosylformylglycinamidine synthase subunit PurS [Nitrospinota bacterium]
MNAKIYITLKKGILEPQGKAIQHSLFDLGYKEIQEVRVGKIIEIKMKGTNKEEAGNKLKEMCKKLLANTVIEDYRFEIDPDVE